MAKPSDTFQWATTLGTTVDPGAARKASGFLYGRLAPPKWFNWLFNGAGQWHAYLNNLHGETEFLNKAYTWTGLHTFSGGVGADPNYGTPVSRWVDMPITLFQLATGWTKQVNYGGSGSTLVYADTAFNSNSPSAQPLIAEFRLPKDVGLTGVSVLVTQGNASGTERVRVKVWRITDDFVASFVNPTATQIGTQVAGASAGLQLLTATFASTVADSTTERFAVTVTPSDTAATNSDWVRSWRIQVSEPGPRNSAG
jgi:hypothetical protein